MNKICKYPGHLVVFAVGGIMYTVTLVNFLNDIL